MAGYLDQIKKAAGSLPVVCAGDIFHKWNSPPELINFAIKHLPPMYAIPGQHDLPLHNLADIRKSAYWTLVEAGVVKDFSNGIYKTAIDPQDPDAVSETGLFLFGFPWGTEVKKPNKIAKYKNSIHLAVVHAYCWKDGHCYPGCPQEEHVVEWAKKLEFFDAAVFGDNHRGFLSTVSLGINANRYILNNGGMYRSKSDELDYVPCYGVLYADGSIERVPFDVSNDKWEIAATEGGIGKDGLEDLIEMLNEVSDLSLDFGDVVRRRVNHKKVPKSVRELVLKLLEGS